MSKKYYHDGTHYLVDLVMLNRCTASYEEYLKTYARFLNVITSASKNDSIQAEADKIAEKISKKSGCPLDDDDFLNITDFLSALRIGFGMGDAQHEDFAAKNSYELIMKVMLEAAEAWLHIRTVMRTFELSSDVFMKEVYPWLPMPNELYALLAAEYAKAREILLTQPEMPQ